MVIVKNVVNSITGETGDLGVVGYKYNDEIKEEIKSDNRGLVIHFNDKYVKSFILTKYECDLVVKYGANIVRDLSYILSVTPTSLFIYDLFSHFTKYDKQDNGYGLSLLSTYAFELKYSSEFIHSYTDNFSAYGLQLVVITALKNLKETDYLVSRELHTPTQIFDFTNIYIE